MDTSRLRYPRSGRRASLCWSDHNHRRPSAHDANVCVGNARRTEMIRTCVLGAPFVNQVALASLSSAPQKRHSSSASANPNAAFRFETDTDESRDEQSAMHKDSEDRREAKHKEKVATRKALSRLLFESFLGFSENIGSDWPDIGNSEYMATFVHNMASTMETTFKTATSTRIFRQASKTINNQMWKFYNDNPLEWLAHEDRLNGWDRMQTIVKDSVATRLHEKDFREGLEWLAYEDRLNGWDRMQTILCEGLATRLDHGDEERRQESHW